MIEDNNEENTRNSTQDFIDFVIKSFKIYHQPPSGIGINLMADARGKWKARDIVSTPS